MKKTILLMAALGLVALQACKEEDTPAANVVDSGTCGAQGSNLIWTLEGDGTLTISGRGTMEDYEITGLEGSGPDEAPSDYKSSMGRLSGIHLVCCHTGGRDKHRK